MMSPLRCWSRAPASLEEKRRIGKILFLQFLITLTMLIEFDISTSAHLVSPRPGVSSMPMKS